MNKNKMVSLLIVCSTICIFPAVNAQTVGDKNIRGNHVRLVEGFTAAIINKDFDAMEHLLHENYTGYGPYINIRKNKSQEIAEWKQVWGQQVLSASYNRSQILTVTITAGGFTGDWVLDYAMVSATYAIRPDKEVTFMYHAAHKIVDNQIAETYHYFNADDVQQQLGL